MVDSPSIEGTLTMRKQVRIGAPSIRFRTPVPFFTKMFLNGSIFENPEKTTYNLRFNTFG